SLPIVFQWKVSTLYGWGVYGLNLALNASKFGQTVTSTFPMRLGVWELDNSRRWLLNDFSMRSHALVQQLEPFNGRVRLSGCVALHSLGNQLGSAGLAVSGLDVFGERTFGVAFLEDSRFLQRPLSARATTKKLSSGQIGTPSFSGAAVSIM
ncbi:MAG TPA: hypothetical protein VGU23_03195, partial [Acidobacteriaceae bacterium]|nr:hypothetical protein [Acidobacteriaceae bacterium]